MTGLLVRLTVVLMEKRVTGLFLCILTFLAFQVQAASAFSICLDPTSSCCSAVESHCCDFSPTDCCVEVPDNGMQFPLPTHAEPVNVSPLGEVESPATLFLSTLSGDFCSPDFTGLDPPLLSGRALLTVVQRFLI